MDKLYNRKEIAIFALGGLGEVGKNMYVIDYLEQLFIVDSGILFPDSHLLGVDYVIPDYTYLVQNQQRIVGLFITHGHEDHIGGIPFLLKKVKIPKIFAAGVTVDLIENKLEDYPELLGSTQIVEFKSHFVYEFKGISVSFIRLNHSIPDSFAICFKTELGTIVHTGDFKIDLTPVGPAAEYEKLALLGQEGVLCLLSDSTNALRGGVTESEKKIGSSIKELFKQVTDRIIVATFASNMFRVQQIIEACVLTNRKVAVFGRSMEKTIEVGQQVGYIKAPKGTIIAPEEIDNYKASEICLLCTGSQGEPLAALSRIANGSHRVIKLMPNDTIIFSSNPIPGNQEGVNKTINQLFRKGANVITHSIITDTHTTGHASQVELKLMLNLLKPKYFMPIHGEYRMQRVHADLAIECGVDPNNTYILENGDVLAINDHSARNAGHVASGDVYIDGEGIGDISKDIIRERRMLSEDGMFSLVITIDTKKKIIPIEPQVVSRGFIYMKDSEALTKAFVDASKKFLLDEMANSNVVILGILKQKLTEFLEKEIYSKTDRKPIVIPVFMDLAPQTPQE
ncbi:ribonuclease J [Anaeroplasma bactoclasticum]|jgi:ribonuclease J|uniref:Ribonuclease J n=1 Tax=Anaeroplasma bactoclasticum TaxID=2088 RepID=A0A397R3Y5_9MOLU|nr:ribonuclease J [Anaeroplasma bactoclasticum]RIA64884.1 ribonuclease J [Anaeroplasma bactoclasticum]